MSPPTGENAAGATADDGGGGGGASSSGAPSDRRPAAPAVLPSSSSSSSSPPPKPPTTPPFSAFSSAAPLIAGISGGAVSTALLYPLDLVKVRLQVNEDPIRSSTTSRRRTIMCTMRGVIRHEGVLGLYQGLTPALVGSAASWGGYFFLYEGIKRRWAERRREERERRRTRASRSSSEAAAAEGVLTRDVSRDMHVDEEMDIRTNSADDGDDGNDDCSLGPTENFAAACAAGAAMVLLTNPLWLIKTRMQLQMKRALERKSHESAVKGVKDNVKDIKPPYRSMTDAARTIVREEGPLALYKGAVPALMLVSHGGVQFVAYEFLKEHFGTYTRAARSQKDERGQKRSSTAEKLQDSLGYLAMGAVSKMIASTVTYPLQVIKARLQQRSQAVELTEGGELAVVRREYGGVADCIGRILRNEGIVGFFKGCVPNAVRVAPSAAITFVTYETVMDLLS